MKNILVIGGGAMGSAFTIPCIENKNNVTITEPYSKKFIKDLSSKNKFHSSLQIRLPKKLKYKNVLAHSSTMIKVDALPDSGYPQLHRAQDHGLWVILASKGKKFGNVPRPLLFHRISENPFQQRGLIYLSSDIKILKIQLRSKQISFSLFCIVFIYKLSRRVISQLVSYPYSIFFMKK